MGDGGDGASLRDIIAVGDYINHAIMTLQELQGGLARLVQVGYVREVAGKFAVVGAAREFWMALWRNHKRRAGLRLWDDLEEFLEVTPGACAAKMAQQTYPGVNAETVEAAYQEYLRSF